MRERGKRILVDSSLSDCLDELKGTLSTGLRKPVTRKAASRVMVELFKQRLSLPQPDAFRKKPKRPNPFSF